ncbi:MAG: hypothetical protein II030_02240, partial [Treponema sp.]|nr:hypothetical protein [Treponema sp.]
IFTTMHKLKLTLEKESSLESKLQKAMPLLSEVLQVNDLYYVGSKGKMKAVLNKNFTADASDLKNVMEEDIFSESSLDSIEKHSPKFHKSLTQSGFESVLVSKVRKDDVAKGYLVCAVKRSLRIWQENERAILFYLADLLANEDF